MSEHGELPSRPLYRVIGATSDGRRRQIMGNLLLHTAEGLAITLRDLFAEADFIVEAHDPPDAP